MTSSRPRSSSRAAATCVGMAPRGVSRRDRVLPQIAHHAAPGALPPRQKDGRRASDAPVGRTLVLDEDALMAPRVMERPGAPPIEDEAVAIGRADRIHVHWSRRRPALIALRTPPILSLTTPWSTGCQRSGGSRSRPARYGVAESRPAARRAESAVSETLACRNR